MNINNFKKITESKNKPNNLQNQSITYCYSNNIYKINQLLMADEY